MARRAYLLFTPDMANEQVAFLREAHALGRTIEEHVVCENELPRDVVQVGSKEARNGAVYMLLESSEFEDIKGRDYPLLPQPRLRDRDAWVLEKIAQARNEPKVVL